MALASGADYVPMPEGNRAISRKPQSARELRPNGGDRRERHFALHTIKLTTQRRRIATPLRFVGLLRSFGADKPLAGITLDDAGAFRMDLMGRRNTANYGKAGKCPGEDSNLQGVASTWS